MIRFYEPEKDYPTLKRWYEARDLGTPDPSYIPPFGLVCDEIAMGWLLGTDTNNSYIESLVSDPDISEVRRGRALVELVNELLLAAKFRGYTRITCLTLHDSVVALSEKLGGRLTKQIVLENDL